MNAPVCSIPAAPAGGSRRFSDADLARLARIQELTNEGVNLEGVRRILALEAELAETREELRRREGELREDLAATHRQYRRDLVPLNQTVAIFVQQQQRGGRS
jgi:MerR family transcriptional regulator/heat shock protein HspR